MGLRDDRFFFPLTSLQIGDLQSYLSQLTIFLAIKSKKLFILVDNRPWSVELDTRPAHLWQLMVTKSRMSPFANTSAKRERRKFGKDLDPTKNTQSISRNGSKLKRLFAVIDAAVSQKKSMFPVEKLKNSFLLNKELHHTLYGFIVFEVSWVDIRGLNYFNELQTDTSLALETKVMKRWEFDSIEQASSYISAWYRGTASECCLLQEYLNSISGSGDVFYDAQECPSTSCRCSENSCHANDIDDGDGSLAKSFSATSSWELEETTSLPYMTPPADGPYKRRKIVHTHVGSDVDEADDEAYSDVISSPTLSASSSSSMDEFGNANINFEVTIYKDVLILFRFNDHDLPFKLKDIIMSDLRLLRLLEYGLPSWVIFLQSYPVLRKIYRPWMCPLARVLYVMISVITVLIGFYDLYKNIPLLKATASRLFGPFFYWIETWEMVTRIKYLGTMLFLQNFEKAVKWFLMVTRAAKSLLSVLTKPIAGPILELVEIIYPVWSECIEITAHVSSIVCFVLESCCRTIMMVLETLMWPFWLLVTTLWSTATYVIYPVLWVIWEVLIAPTRLVLAIASFLGTLFVNSYYFLKDLWFSMSALFQFASTSQTTVSAEVSIWKSLWSELLSKVFRALKSIFYGFVAFFTACNRHRLSIYNHICEIIRLLCRSTRSSGTSRSVSSRKQRSNKTPLLEGEKFTTKTRSYTTDKVRRRRSSKDDFNL